MDKSIAGHAIHYRTKYFALFHFYTFFFNFYLYVDIKFSVFMVLTLCLVFFFAWVFTQQTMWVEIYMELTITFL